MTTTVTKPRTTEKQTSAEGAPAPAGQFPLASKALEVISLPRHREMPEEFEGRMKKAEAYAAGGLCPQLGNDVMKIFFAIEYGATLGLSAIFSAQNMCVVQGRATLMFQAQLAVAVSSGQLEDWQPIFSPDGASCTYRIVRRGKPTPIERSYSLADATKAGLATKDNWKKFQPDMLIARAGSRALKEAVPEILAGLPTPEEMEDAAADVAPPATPARPAWKMGPDELSHLRTIIEVHKVPNDVQLQIRNDVLKGRAIEFHPSGDKKGIPLFTEAEYKEIRARLIAYKAGIAPAAPAPAVAAPRPTASSAGSTPPAASPSSASAPAAAPTSPASSSSGPAPSATSPPASGAAHEPFEEEFFDNEEPGGYPAD